LIIMSEKQNPRMDEDDSSQLEDEQSVGQHDASPKSYYYDDSTGYEIYKDESDDSAEGETS